MSIFRIIKDKDFLSKDMMRLKLDQMRKAISHEIDFDEVEEHNVPPWLESIKNPMMNTESNPVSK